MNRPLELSRKSGWIVLWKLGAVTVVSALVAALLYRRSHREGTGTVEAGKNLRMEVNGRSYPVPIDGYGRFALD